MKRLMPAAGLAALALFPAGAVASTSRAKVVSVNARGHRVELVDSTRVVRTYRYLGKLPRLGLGDAVAYRRSGDTISRVRRTARPSGTMSFYATVVSAGSRRVRLRLGDGSPLTVASRQVSATASRRAARARAASDATAPAAPITVQVVGLAPGETVLISETVDAAGHWTITITLPSAASGGDAPGDDSTVDQVAEGAITQVSGAGLAISTPSGPLTFSVDPESELTEGFAVGDVVDVTYSASTDGTLSAGDVEYLEQDVTGVVGAVSDGSVTLTAQATGQPVMFTADPALGLFTGVAPGDQVDVTYHQSAGGDVADAVDDQAWES